jgi:hypothetical protein
MTRRSLLSCLFASVVTISVAHDASAQSRFAVVTLLNQTPDVTVHFQYRWGNNPQWTSFQNFRPGGNEWFAIPLDGNGQAPPFEMKINEAVGAAQRIDKLYTLQWKPAPDRGSQFGHQHAIRRDQNDRDYIDVYNLGR